MRKIVFIVCLILNYNQINAQFFDNKSILISQSFQFYNEKSLNNKFNYSNEIAKGFQLEMVSKIKPALSLNKGLGFGLNNNVNNTKLMDNGMYYIRAITGLKLHLPYNTEDPKYLVNPFLLINYHFDCFYQNKSQFILSNLNYGLGVFIPIKKELGLIMKASHHQELGLEYRTFYSLNFGIISGI